MLNLRSLIGKLPSAVQYLVIFLVVMAVLYLALWLTRKIGSHFDSEKVNYDDPEKYADSVPDLFATSQFRKKKASGKERPKEPGEEEQPSADGGEQKKEPPREEPSKPEDDGSPE